MRYGAASHFLPKLPNYSGLQVSEVQRNRFVCVAAALMLPLHNQATMAVFDQVANRYKSRA
ncbi:hypothetical protein [Microseira wollei]|uniref:hypothetical protein n=1 Tax=Microseira wollei TaxID=467598 RepID=UPI001CFD15DD|nr:hypothetical protein [Microseira wollei]